MVKNLHCYRTRTSKAQVRIDFLEWKYNGNLGTHNKLSRRKNDLKLYHQGKESVSTKNTSSCNHTATDLSLETKPLSQRKSFVNEKEKADRAFEIVHKEFYSSNTNPNASSHVEIGPTNNYYENTMNRKTKVADLIYCEDNRAVGLGNSKSNHDTIAMLHQMPNSAPAPLPKNFKRIPAMMENLVRKEELMRKANESGLRGRSESNHRIHAMSDTASHARRGSCDRPGNIKDYKIGRQIGKGAYAVVKLVTDRASNELLAMKVYEKYKLTDPARRKSVTREIAIMKRLDHENIIRMHKSFDNPHSIHIVMDFVKGKSLYQYLKEKPGKRMSEEEAKAIIRQIAGAIKYIHSLNVAHRDLKLENIIINSKTQKVTLIDFGFSITSGHEKKLKIF